MGITSRCTACDAVSLDGVLLHNKGCVMFKNSVTDYIRPPAITVTFDSPKEQQAFIAKLKGSHAGGTDMTSERPDANKEVVESPKAPAEALHDEIDEILIKAFNDFYDYITEKDIIKAAHEYSEKTVFKEAKAKLTAYAATVEREADTKARIDELRHLRTSDAFHFATDVRGMKYVNERLAALQGPQDTTQ